MKDSLFNVEFVNDTDKVDTINKDFYGKFSYPWPPMSFPQFSKADMLKLVSQDFGDYTHSRFPGNPRIWVAGCGTNQAVFTALKYPGAQVVATDVSTNSLAIAEKNAKSIGITNLKFIEKSINDSYFKQEFDFVICTGVVHHNANPPFTLSKLRDGLKKDGVMEFMVYNYYHRLLTVATQKAIRALAASSKDFDDQFSVARRLISKFPVNNFVGDFVGQYKNSHPAELADALFQPLEYSYTVETLEELVSGAGLEILQPCMKLFEKSKDPDVWNIKFEDPQLEKKYYSLPDLTRWQIANLLMFNNSAPLWFYLQRKESSFDRQAESQICDAFLETKFRKFYTETTNYVIQKDGSYVQSDRTVAFPRMDRPSDELASKVYDAIDPKLTMGEIFRKLDIPVSFTTVNRIRIDLSTTEHAFILAVN